MKISTAEFFSVQVPVNLNIDNYNNYRGFGYVLGVESIFGRLLGHFFLQNKLKIASVLRWCFLIEPTPASCLFIFIFFVQKILVASRIWTRIVKV